VAHSEHRRVEILFKPLEFGFDFRFSVVLGLENFNAGGVGGEADGVERGFVAGDEFDEGGLFVVGKLIGEA
jgi:hypothetical protein